MQVCRVWNLNNSVTPTTILFLQKRKVPCVISNRAFTERLKRRCYCVVTSEMNYSDADLLLSIPQKNLSSVGMNSHQPAFFTNTYLALIQ